MHDLVLELTLTWTWNQA